MGDIADVESRYTPEPTVRSRGSRSSFELRRLCVIREEDPF
jgi:hypothetical protein